MYLPLPKLLLMGGSFNPLHLMHIRMAVEAAEVLQPEKVIFMPAATPPHKPDAKLLPYSVRVELLRKSLVAFPHFVVSTLEGEREGPSYTYDTVKTLGALHPNERIGFLMGSEDLPTLSTWSRWQELEAYTDFILLGRGNYGLAEVEKDVAALWGTVEHCFLPIPVVAGAAGAVVIQGKLLATDRITHAVQSQEMGAVFTLPQGGRVIYLAQPRMEISSSLVRERWLAGRSVYGLVPEAVQMYLQENAIDVEDCWT